MRITLYKYPTETDWYTVKYCSLVTVGKVPILPPDEIWKKKMLNARHSPIRELKFIFRMENIPSYVATHLARHIHAQPYIKSQRNDRQNEYDRNSARQDAPVDMMYSVNAEELMIIANKRLCGMADKTTRKVVSKMCKKVVKVCPEFKSFLVPMCKYHGGVCHEFNSCNANKTNLYDYEEE